MPTEVSSEQQLDQMLGSADGNRLFVLDFYANWCGPCKMIAPLFEQLSKQFTNATFLKINVDIARGISQRFGVQAMPTFILIKRNTEIQRIQGADARQLQEAISRHHTLQTSTGASEIERQFLSQFVTQSEKVQAYRDEIARTLALSLVPAESLIEQSTVDGKLNWLRLAEGLLSWFKNDFFSWTDSPTCPACGTQTTQGSGLSGTPNKEEIDAGANRVEIYYCKCGREVRFPRYNDPLKLLETRTGRCGEWANCFTLIAFSMGFDARFVYDVTDHVWTELFIPVLNRWVHADPCENCLDKPLLYELGWNKKLSYVIAFGLDHVYDVTWRYSADHFKTLKLRKRVREPVLANFLKKLNTRMGQLADAPRLKILSDRRLCELVEMIVVEKRTKDGTYGGRITGTLEWRSARGELGNESNSIHNSSTPLTIEAKELQQKRFSLRYNVATNEYTRGDTIVKDWKECTFSFQNVQRKVENDWKMAYLCRTEGSSQGEIEWAINLTSSALKIKKVEVQFHGLKCFENGNIFATVCAGDICMRIPESGKIVLDTVPNCVLKMKVSFGGGSGNAFQHAQLFRSNLNEIEDQMRIEIELE